MPVVSESVELPADVAVTQTIAQVQLYQGDRAPLGEARNSVTGETVAGRRVVVLDGTTAESPSAGSWSLDLAANADLVPAGTVWGRRLIGPQLDTTLSYATVPDAGGPFEWQQILTDPPATIESSALVLGLATKVDRAGDTVTGPLTVDADATITGEILTGTFGTPATFGGIEREARFFPAGAMMSPTGVVNFGDGFPRINMPAGVTTDVYAIFEVEEWWLGSTIGVYFEWSNDHTTTGDVRFDCDVKECDIATETLAAADVIATRTFTAGSAAANVATTSIVARVTPEGLPCSFDPGPFASFYRLRITRLGADVADTLAGPIGLIAASMTRGQ